MNDEKRKPRSFSEDLSGSAPVDSSNGASDEEFVTDEELQRVLAQWDAPGASPLHERRMMDAYRRHLSGEEKPANAVSSAAFPQQNSEVVKMKTCSTCHEDFADKFSFCPVDGTPLNGHVAHAVEPSSSATSATQEIASPSIEAAAVAPPSVSASESLTTEAVGATTLTSAAAAMVASDNEYHLTMLEDEGLISRLTAEMREVAHESQLTWPEFKRDPGGFTRRFIGAYSLLIWRFFRSPNVAIATLAAIFVVLSAVLGIILADRYKSKTVTEAEHAELFDMSAIPPQDIPEEQKPVEKGNAGMNKGKGGGSKQKQEKPSGGGGGGQDQPKPVSQGKPPQASLIVPPIVRPNVTPPAIKNPSLPTPATLDLDPKLARNDLPPMPYGDLKSKSTDPSAGKGTGGGLGDGKGLGAGSGEGGGLGPGRGGNTGGGDRGLGGGGAGGGGGGEDYNRVFKSKEVTRKAIVTYKPEPAYTEEARKNQVTGTVILSVVLASNGEVTNIKTVSGLPSGLTEKAIEAARKIKFTPAQKDGHSVSQYTQIALQFTIY
ncbi:MAG: energy transducer TonB [Pyrinomonadaceae bacterium]